MDPEEKSLNGLFSLLNMYILPKSLKFSHWPSKPTWFHHAFAATTFPFRRPAWNFLGPLSCTGDGPVEVDGKVAPEILNQIKEEKAIHLAKL